MNLYFFEGNEGSLWLLCAVFLNSEEVRRGKGSGNNGGRFELRRMTFEMSFTPAKQ